MKRFVSILALLLAAIPALAQIDPTVEVSRSYDVRLQDIHKPVMNPVVDDSLHRFDISFDYSIFNRPYSDLYDFTPYESIQLSTVGANRTPFVYAKIGSQYSIVDRGFIPAGELYLQSKPKKGFCTGLYARHNSFDGLMQVPEGFSGDPINAKRMENTVGGDLTYDWATGEMMVDLKYDFDKYNYSVDSPVREMQSHLNNSFSGSVNLNSANTDDNSIYYDITLGYRNASKDFSWGGDSYGPDDNSQILHESSLKVNGFVGASFDIHRVFINMNIEYAKYSELFDFSAGIVEFSPMYQYNTRRLDARIGVKFGSRYGIAGSDFQNGGDLSATSNIFPDIDARYTLVDKSLWLHTVISGGNDLHQFSSLVDDCPIVVPSSTLVIGSRPLDAKLAVESVISGRLGINVEGGYKIWRDKLLFTPVQMTDNFFRIESMYKDVNHFFIGGELFWKSQDVTVGGKVSYNQYTDEDNVIVSELPAFTGNAFARYSFRERIIAQVDCKYRGAVSGKMWDYTPHSDPDFQGPLQVPYHVGSIIDLDLNVNFLVNKHLAVYVKCGNILDRRNQYLPLFVEPGRNYGAGVCLNF